MRSCIDENIVQAGGQVYGLSHQLPVLVDDDKYVCSLEGLLIVVEGREVDGLTI